MFFIRQKREFIQNLLLVSEKQIRVIRIADLERFQASCGSLDFVKVSPSGSAALIVILESDLWKLKQILRWKCLRESNSRTPIISMFPIFWGELKRFSSMKHRNDGNEWRMEHSDNFRTCIAFCTKKNCQKGCSIRDCRASIIQADVLVGFDCRNSIFTASRICLVNRLRDCTAPWSAGTLQIQNK